MSTALNSDLPLLQRPDSQPLNTLNDRPDHPSSGKFIVSLSV